MITYQKGWHYLAVTKMFALLRRITSKHNLLQQKISSNFMKKYIKINIFVELFCLPKRITC